MVIIATSDCHGSLPEIPPCDLLLIGGDVCPIWNHELSFQRDWLDVSFRNWLSQVPAKKIIGIAGNHDFIFEHQQVIDALFLPWTYLKDSGTLWNRLAIWGLPWVPNLPAWAFHLDQEGLKLRYDSIPKATNIVLSHGPPFGYGDKVWYQKPHEISPHVGCKSATDMLARVKPQTVITGHIHEAFGHYRFVGRDHTTHVYNVSYLDSNYAPGNGVVEIGLSDDIITDAIEDQADIERQIRDTDTDSRQSSEPVEGSEPRELAVASV